MHTNIKYDGTEQEKDAKAIEDIKEYLGEDKYSILVALAKSEAHIDYVENILGFAGIQGYPVNAFLRTYRAEDFKRSMN